MDGFHGLTNLATSEAADDLYKKHSDLLVGADLHEFSTFDFLSALRRWFSVSGCGV